MFHLSVQSHQKISACWSAFIHGIVYLPGSAIILYGIWLSVTV